MAEIINLRQMRKSKNREDKERRAETNRALFGRTKSEKQRQSLEAAKQQRHLDSHKRERPTDETDGAANTPDAPPC